MIYETQKMTWTQISEFCRRFDLEIGTEREINEIEIDRYYAFCSEMETVGEVNACRKFEASAMLL